MFHILGEVGLSKKSNHQEISTFSHFWCFSWIDDKTLCMWTGWGCLAILVRIAVSKWCYNTKRNILLGIKNVVISSLALKMVLSSPALWIKTAHFWPTLNWSMHSSRTESRWHKWDTNAVEFQHNWSLSASLEPLWVWVSQMTSILSQVIYKSNITDC